MRKQELYQVDAFASELFRGNPAAVCILERWLPEGLMQAIAGENNLSETAFAVPVEEGYEIRWFTPVTEVALCGHATLATAHVLFDTREQASDHLLFHSRERGVLTVSRDRDWLILDFPADPPKPVAMPQGMCEAMGAEPLECLQGSTDYLLIYPNQDAIDALQPDHTRLGRIPARGVIVSAPGMEVDFVSRFFAPQSGVPEDPVTGSAHTVLTPYWAARFGKMELTAQQRSPRGGFLHCELRGDRVHIAGNAVTYMKAEIYLPSET